jgi:gentisate 1,2-dioxygenase
MAQTRSETAEALEAFYREIEDQSMDALWRRHQQGDRPSDPAAPYGPYHWNGADIQRFMSRAGELVQPGPDAQRRVLILSNPGVKPAKSATHTLSGNVQMVLPGEIAPSHRHTNAAIRFIMQGEGAVTIVDGEPVEMRPGDLVLTPGWCYHGHVSKAAEPVLWMDSLDGPLVVGMLRIARYQQYPDELEPATKPVGASFTEYGHGNFRPMWKKEASKISPQLLYPWTQTERALRELARTDASPFDDVAFEYTNPTTGGPVLPTIGCTIQMIRPGVHTRAHRHSACAVYHVFRGEGYSVIDGVRFDWKAGDFFSLPPWAWHEHANTSSTEEAIIFATTDAPVLDALSLLEEEEYPGPGGHQTVTSSFRD